MSGCDDGWMGWVDGRREWVDEKGGCNDIPEESEVETV